MDSSYRRVLKEEYWAWLSALVFVVLVSAGCGKAEEKEGKGEAPALPPVKVKVETVQPSAVSEKTTLIGRLDSRHAVALYAKVDGNIQRILVKPGEHVRPGQMVIEIDSLKQEATVATKESDLAAAQADHQKELAHLRSLKAQREAQQASVEYNQHEYVRNYWLEQRGVVSESTVDGYDRTYKVSKAKLAEIDADISAQAEVINRAAKSVTAAKFALKEQKEQLAYYRVTAPSDGTVSDIPVKVGEYVNSSTKLTTISQLRPLELNVLVPKVMAGDLRKGMKLEMVDEKDALIASCPIFHIDPIVDEQNQSVLVKALFENNEERYRPEQSVSTRLVLSQRQGISIPTDALSFIAGRAFAYVVSTGPDSKPVAQQRALRVASLQDNRVVLSEGIKVGDQVVVSGIQNLKDGSPLIVE